MGTLAELQTKLTLYEAAEEKLVTSGVAEVEIGDTRFRRIDLQVIVDRIKELQRAIARASGRTGFGVTRFGRPS